MPDIPNVWLNSPQVIFATSIALKKHLCFISKVCFQMWNAIYCFVSTMEFELLAHGGCGEMGRKKNWYALPVIVFVKTYIKVYDKLMHCTCSYRNQLPADISHCLHIEIFFTLELNPSYAIEIANMARICICPVDNSVVKETIWHAFNLL